MHEVGHRPGAGEHVARLGELQRHLLRGAEIEATAEHYRARPCESPRQRGEAFFLIHGLTQLVRHLLEGTLEAGIRRERGRDHCQCHQAGEICLGRGNAQLGTCEHRDHEPGRRSKRRACLIGDRDGERALTRCLCDDRDHIRRLTRLRDSNHALTFQAGRACVVGEHRRRCQRHQHPLAPAEKVPTVVRCVVGAASRRDDETARTVRVELTRNRLQRGAALRKQPGGDLRLLTDLVAEPAHRLNLTRPPTHVWRTRSSASSTTRSAHAPTLMRPSRRSPSTRAGTDDAIVIARSALIPGSWAVRRTRSSMVDALPASVPSSSFTTIPSLYTRRPESWKLPGAEAAAAVWSVVSAMRDVPLTLTSCCMTDG